MAKQIVVVGGGVGGTLTANLLARKLRPSEARVTLVDETGLHVYQPGWLYLPFGEAKPAALVRPEHSLLSKRVELVVATATRIDPQTRQVHLEGRAPLSYDYLVLATGARLAPEEVPGLEEGAHHFYSARAATHLAEALAAFRGGRIVVGVAGIPYRCPPAPLEFTLLLDHYLRRRGIREQTEITYLSPINRVFTIESVSQFITPILEARGIAYQTFFNVESVDPAGCTVQSLEGESLPYDLLVLVPPHRGSRLIEESGLGDEQGWLPTDRYTLQVKGLDGVYALGDATDLPVSKSGSAAHFEAKVVAERIVDELRGQQRNGHAPTYNGRVMCFLETGFGEATTLSFDYDHPPTPPRPSWLYHYEKLLFNRAYWYLVPPGLV